MFVFCIITFKPFQKALGGRRKRFCHGFHPLSGKFAETQGSKRAGVFLGGGKIRNEFFTVLSRNRVRNLHAMVANKAVDHFQLVEKVFFVERFAPEKEPDLVQDFLILDPSEVSALRFFVVFFESGDDGGGRAL